MFRFLHASGSLLPLLGLAAPVSGMLIQPIVGQLSDITHTRIGKRHPYLLGWTITATLACFLMPFAQTLFSVTILIWIISCSVNGAIECLRAYTGDVIADEQKPTAFAWQTFFAGIGATFATAMPLIFSAFHRSNFSESGIPLSLKFTFLFGGILWGFILAYTFKYTLSLVKYSDIDTTDTTKTNIFTTLIHNIKTMPISLRNFSVIQFFTWMGMYIFWLYFSLALAQRISTLSSTAALAKTTLSTDFYFGIYQFVSIIFALCIPFLTKFFSPIKLHGTALAIGGACIVFSALFMQHTCLIACMCGIGILWGSIMTLPYAIVSTGVASARMGTTFGLFNLSITVPQITAGILLHSTYGSVFHHHAIYLVFISGVLVLMSSVLTLLYNPNISLFRRAAQYWQQLKCIHASHYLLRATTESEQRLLTLFIIFLMTLSQLAITIYLSAMPLMTKAFATNHAHIQLTITVYLIGYGLSQFIYGPLSDIYGRRIMILIGLSLFIFATACCVFTSSIQYFLVARFLQGIGMGCGDTMGRAILCDKFQNDRFIKAAAIIGMAATIMPFAGPLMGSYLQTYFHWRDCFLLIFFYGISVLFLVFYFLPETKTYEQLSVFNLKSILNSYQFILRNRIFLGFFIPGLVCFIGEIIYSITSPFLIQQELGYSAIEFGWFTLFTISGLLIGTIIAHFSAEQIKHQAMVYYGLLIQVIAGVLMLTPSLFHHLSLFFLVFPMTIFMIGVGMIYPNTNMGALTPFTATAGIAGALQGGLQMLLGGIIASHVTQYSVRSALPLSTSLFLLSGVGLVLFYRLIYRETQQ